MNGGSRFYRPTKAAANVRFVLACLMLAGLPADLLAQATTTAPTTVAAKPRFPILAPALPPGQSGYSVFVQADGCEASRGGFHANRFTIETNPCIAVATARRFQISFNDADGSWVAAPLTIRAGQASATVDLLVSSEFSSNGWAHLRIESEHEGVLTDNYTSLGTGSNQTIDGANLMPRTLLINSSLLAPAVDATTFTKRKAWGQTNRTLQKKKGKIGLPSIHVAQEAFQHPSFHFDELDDAFSTVDAWSHVFACRPIDLPANWAALTSVDQAFLSFADLQKVSRLPQQRQAVRRWVAAGGTLVVLAPKTQHRQRDQVLPLLIGTERATMLDTSFDRWLVPNQRLQELRETIVDVSRINEIWTRQNYVTNGGAFFDLFDLFDFDDAYDRADWQSEPTEKVDAPQSAPFIMQHFSNGLVVLVDDDTDGWGEQGWRFFYNSLQLENIPFAEHLGSGNVGFHEPQFWIPEVGDPPVRAFQILITVFMIVAGPIMLVLLMRTRRMQLLFTIIPLLSLLTCGSLFAYAMLSDGLVTLGRVRSFTRIDSRTGDAVTHARASYYSGWHPKPYQFDLGTVAIQNTHSRGNLTIRRDQNDNSFRFSGGRIRARSPHRGWLLFWRKCRRGSCNHSNARWQTRN